MTTTTVHTNQTSTSRAKTVHFIRHFVEMLIAMLPGMAVVALLPAIGTAVDTILMAAGMSVSMAAWMRYRRHGWVPIAEMTGAMFVPAFAAIGLYWAGVLGAHGVMAVEHMGMVPAMLAVMLWRRDEYTGAAHAPHGS